MKRTNVFEMLADKSKNTIEINFQRIYRLYDEYCFCTQNMLEFTLSEFVEEYAFDSWKNKGRCIDLEDFMQTINFDSIICGAKFDLNDFLTFIEVIYNFYYMSKKCIDHSGGWFTFNTEVYKLKELMDSCLSDYNYSAFYNKEREQVIVLEDNPEAVAVAENLEPEIAFDVVRYNHHALKGDIKAKKHILTVLGSELEPKRKSLKAINSELEDMIFFILNNANIRHNNISLNDKNYRKFIANISNVELEELESVTLT